MLRQRAHLLALLELAAERVDLLADGEAGRAAVLGGVSGGGGSGGDFVVGGGEGVGLALLQLLELFGDARVDLLLEQLGT